MKDPPRTIRGKVALDAELAQAERAKQQEPEDAMAELLDEMHIHYRRQFKYSVSRKLRADFVVLLGQDWILIEVVGGIWKRQAHGSIAGVLADIDRLNEATASGFKMLRMTPEMISEGIARAILERLLE